MSSPQKIIERETIFISVLLLLAGAGALAYMYLTPSRVDRQQARWDAAAKARQERRARLASEQAETAAFDRHVARVNEKLEKDDPPRRKITRRKRRKRKKRRRRKPKKPRIIRYSGTPARNPAGRVIAPANNRSVRGTVITMYMTPY